MCKVWKGHLHALADEIFLVQALATGIGMYPSHWRPATPAHNHTFQNGIKHCLAFCTCDQHEGAHICGFNLMLSEKSGMYMCGGHMVFVVINSSPS